MVIAFGSYSVDSAEAIRSEIQSFIQKKEQSSPTQHVEIKKGL